jgi:flavodoxin
VAEAISRELGCRAVDVEKERPDTSGVDLILVGSGNYGGNTDDRLLRFLNDLQPSNGCTAAVFATAGGHDLKCVHVIQEALETKGYQVISSFNCLGQFFFANRGHPTEDDLKDAKAFASDIKKRIGD